MLFSLDKTVGTVGVVSKDFAWLIFDRNELIVIRRDELYPIFFDEIGALSIIFEGGFGKANDYLKLPAIPDRKLWEASTELLTYLRNF